MTFKTTNPCPGDFGLVRIGGLTGKGVSLGQRLIGSGSYFTHAFIVGRNGYVIQAEPGGAEIVPFADAVGSQRVAYSAFDLTDQQRTDIVAAACRMVGTPYSFLDYLAIAAERLVHFDALERFVSADGHLICSQLVDEAYAIAGIELFPDRVAGDVAPGDLARLIGAK
jgi:uncharacterized protein YycO